VSIQYIILQRVSSSVLTSQLYHISHISDSQTVFSQKIPFQTVKISFSKLSKFLFPNCQNFPLQTVKIFLFQTVKISFSKLSKFLFPNCQNFPLQTVKIFLFQNVKISLFKLSKFSFPNCQKNFFSNCQKNFFPNCQNFPFTKVWETLNWIFELIFFLNIIFITDPKTRQIVQRKFKSAMVSNNLLLLKLFFVNC
jgi:hypothetical protein